MPLRALPDTNTADPSERRAHGLPLRGDGYPARRRTDRRDAAPVVIREQSAPVAGDRDAEASAVDELATVHDILARGMPPTDPRDPSDVPTIELAQTIDHDLRNARALVAKLQHLLDSARHELEALRTASESLIVRDNDQHHLETVPLRELLQHASLHLEEGQALTIHPGEHCSISVFDKDFVCAHEAASDMLTAAATLQRAEVPA